MSGDITAKEEPDGRVADAVAAARSAGAKLVATDGRELTRIREAVGEALTDPETIARFGRLAADETGRGHPGAKVEKITTAVRGARSAARKTSTTGVIDRDGEQGTLTVARPVGVVGTAVPTTHPVVVPAVVSLYALAGRNAVVFAPSPSTVETCDVVVETIRGALSDVGLPPELVSTVPAPVSKPGTDSLFELVDVACAAGGETTVAAGQRCGTPNLCTGADGLVTVVDGSVPASEAATNLAVGATYDFGSHPAADAAVVTTLDAADDLVASLRAEGGYVLDERERDRLRSLVTRAEGELPEAARGCSPRWLTAEIDLPPDARRAAFLVVEPVDQDDPLATLPGVPAVAVHKREGFGSVLALAADLGSGHAAAIHTERQRRVKRAATSLRVGRLVVNQPGIATVGSPRSGFPVAPLLGGGTDEGNQLTGGLTVDDFIETTTVATEASTLSPIDGQGAGTTWRGP